MLSDGKASGNRRIKPVGTKTEREVMRGKWGFGAERLGISCSIGQRSREEELIAQAKIGDEHQREQRL